MDFIADLQCSAEPRLHISRRLYNGFEGAAILKVGWPKRLERTVTTFLQTPERQTRRDIAR